MGGYGSTRWQGKAVRRTTGVSLRLEIGELKAYLGGETYLLGWSWKRGEREMGNVTLKVEPGCVTLLYTTTRDGATETIRDPVAVERTPCNYGGTRAWFACPGCELRCAALYLPPGATRFRCRTCHKLAHGTQQMDAHDRHMHRIRVIERQLGAEGQYSPFRVPPKPKGMHWRTYQRLHEAFLKHEVERNKYLAASFERLTARFEKLDIPR